jgi:hypothetical protein
MQMKTVIVTLMTMVIAISGTTSGQSLRILDSIESYVKANELHGSMLIQKGQEAFFSKSYGLANQTFKVKNTHETRYKMPSITNHAGTIPCGSMTYFLAAPRSKSW